MSCSLVYPKARRIYLITVASREFLAGLEFWKLLYGKSRALTNLGICEMPLRMVLGPLKEKRCSLRKGFIPSLSLIYRTYL